jgi:hypothetical protein
MTRRKQSPKRLPVTTGSVMIKVALSAYVVAVAGIAGVVALAASDGSRELDHTVVVGIAAIGTVVTTALRMAAALGRPRSRRGRK